MSNIMLPLQILSSSEFIESFSITDIFAVDVPPISILTLLQASYYLQYRCSKHAHHKKQSHLIGMHHMKHQAYSVCKFNSEFSWQKTVVFLLTVAEQNMETLKHLTLLSLLVSVQK